MGRFAPGEIHAAALAQAVGEQIALFTTGQQQQVATSGNTIKGNSGPRRDGFGESLERVVDQRAPSGKALRRAQFRRGRAIRRRGRTIHASLGRRAGKNDRRVHVAIRERIQIGHLRIPVLLQDDRGGSRRRIDRQGVQIAPRRRARDDAIASNDHATDIAIANFSQQRDALGRQRRGIGHLVRANAGRGEGLQIHAVDASWVAGGDQNRRLVREGQIKNRVNRQRDLRLHGSLRR